MRTDPNPGAGGVAEGPVEETAGGNTDGDVDKDIEQMDCIRMLLNSISLFGLLSSSNCIKEELIHRYYQSIHEILMLLKPSLEESFISRIALETTKLTELFFHLDALLNEARDLLGSWRNMTSKVYFVLKIEPVITRLKRSAELLISSHPCVDELEVSKNSSIHDEETFDNLKEAIEDQKNKRLPNPDNLEKISNALSLSSNQELLMEIVALDKLKSKVVRGDSSHAELENIDHATAIVACMHERHLKANQLQSINGVSIPADFCCPLSLRLMFDPVIVASGQTYERAFIKNWIEVGFNVCAKTRQTLGHSNLIPNYTVKALIANWCESNNIKLPDPVKSRNQSSSNGIHLESYQHELVAADDGSASAAVSNDRRDEEEAGDPRMPSRVPSDLTRYSSDASGEVMQEVSTSSAPRAEPEPPSKFAEVRARSGQNLWRRPSERFAQKVIIPSPCLDDRPDLSGVEARVRKLVEELRSDSVEVQTAATEELRLLAKHNMENRIVIASCGSIPLLVGLLYSGDPKTQENAVTALLNLSINDNNKTAIANADAIDPLIHVLETGNPEAKENSAATLFSLSVVEENKVRIGRSGAIKPLVELLGSGTPRGKKDAATALFNLSIFHENKARIVEAGAVRHLVELMDPAAGMVDKAVAVLANLATIPDGRTAIGREGGIPLLVEVVELGSARGKENAAAALLQLCTNNSNRFCSIVLQEGAVPPLVALSQSGTPRAKEKAQALLSYFRNQRHGNAGRA